MHHVSLRKRPISDVTNCKISSHLLFTLRAAITLNVEMSSRKRKILTLEFSVGVITDVHSVPVPIETQDVCTNPYQSTICTPSMWVWMGVAAARDTSDERPPVLRPFLMGLRGGHKWEGLL